VGVRAYDDHIVNGISGMWRGRGRKRGRDEEKRGE
jgi:hypothetical protein